MTHIINIYGYYVAGINIRYRGVAKYHKPPLCYALFTGKCVMLPIKRWKQINEKENHNITRHHSPVDCVHCFSFF